MKTRPILFSASMVQAILANRKTQTRRIVKGIPHDDVHRPFVENGWVSFSWEGHQLKTGSPKPAPSVKCPFGVPGDRLWCRETWNVLDEVIDGTEREDPVCVGYRADLTGLRHEGGRKIPIDVYGLNWGHGSMRWRPSIFMPKWASRITLEITAVRVEKLQSISHEDAIAEGLSTGTKDGTLYKFGIADRDGLLGNDDAGWHWQDWEVDPREAYRKLWESINGAGAWELSPWVWVIEFKRVTP